MGRRRQVGEGAKTSVAKGYRAMLLRGAVEVISKRAVSCRVRYFADGAVIGSRSFVNGVFEKSREQFGPRRRDGARKPRGALEGLAGEIWSFRDLQKE